VTQPPPDKQSATVRAWRMDTPATRKAHEREWGHGASAGLASWMVNGPYHILWNWWYVGVVSLRDFPGIPPAKKNYDDAEYELSIWSIDSPPGGTITPDIAKLRAGDLTARGSLLHPADLIYQFDGVTDDQAVKICDSVIAAIVDGYSPDSDYREWWKRSLDETVNHFRAGIHT